METKGSVLFKKSRAGLYHVEVTPWIKNISRGVVQLNYSKHATQRCLDKHLPILWSVRVDGHVFEAEMNDAGIATKLALRVPLNTTHDLCLVIREVQPGTWVVITAWANAKADSHTTLDRSKYVSHDGTNAKTHVAAS